ncbi:hypothetical protein NE644_22185, partial [Blautia wexlerae]|nr:hypothetical protein [Blautia wexlerae]
IAKPQTDERRQDSKLNGFENNAHIRSFEENAEILQGDGERQHLVSVFCKCILCDQYQRDANDHKSPHKISFDKSSVLFQ